MSISIQAEKLKPNTPSKVKIGVPVALMNHLQHNMDELQTCSLGSLEIVGCLAKIANNFAEIFHKTRLMEYLQPAIKYFLAAVSGALGDDQRLPRWNNQLSVLYNSRFKIEQNFDDLDTACRLGLVSLQTSTLGDPDLVVYQANIAAICIERYKWTGHITDLDCAIRCLKAVVDPAPPRIAGWTIDAYVLFGTAYHCYYGITGELEDIESALGFFSKAVAMIPTEHPIPPNLLMRLGVCFHSKYCRFGQLNDLTTAWKYCSASWAAMIRHSSILPVVYQGFGVIAKTWYKENGVLVDLENASNYFREASIKFPQGHPVSLPLQTTTGMLHLVKYKRTHNVEDLEIASKNILAAVTATPDRHPDLRHRHEYLGMCYSEKYAKYGDLEDLKAAIKYLWKAVSKISALHYDSPQIQSKLGDCYLQRYYQRLKIKDLESAIEHSLVATTKTPKEYPDLPYMILTLGYAHIERYNELNTLGDLDDTTLVFLDIMGTITDKHPGSAAVSAGLGLAFLGRFKGLGIFEDLDTAIDFSYDAVNASLPTNPNLPQWLCNLAESYAMLHIYFPEAEADALKDSYEYFKLALESKMASPQMIWKVSEVYTSLVEIFSSDQLLMGYNVALNNIPTLLWLGSTIKKTHNILVQYNVSKFISKGVWTALQASKIETAVEFMEQGLSTTHKQTLQLRDEHNLLQAHFPLLSEKLQEVSIHLQRASHTLDQSENYYVLAQERQEIISEIHKQSGFERFLLAPKYSKLCLAARYGPVVLLNYADSNADAIILLSPSASPVHLFLSGVTSLGLQECITDLKNLVKNISSHSQNIRFGTEYKFSTVSSHQTLESVTAWIWEKIVKPIFDVIYENGIKDGRLWWCPSGQFTYLPLHAAAPLESSFIQSYTPTLETLIHANQMYSAKRSKESDNLTAIGVIKAPGTWGELLYVENELDFVAEIFRENSKQLKDSQATVDNVMEVIESSSWLHLACHGQQHPTDPLKSSLILHDGVIELGQIMYLNLSKAKFVYLSACETAMGDSELSNEAMHLVGGFLAAGFQGAIGTLWSMSDVYGPKVAEIVYNEILGDDNIPDPRRAAKGLHLAIKRLREEGASPHQWMPFIHLGV